MNHDRRKCQRLFMRLPAKLRTSKGFLLAGRTVDLSERGALFVPEEANDAIQPGEEGSICFYMVNDQVNFYAEIPCRVVHIARQGIGIAFEHLTGEQFLEEADGGFLELIREGQRVHVHRSDGGFEAGWQVVASNEVLPEVIATALAAKNREGICRVVRKMGPAHAKNDQYKIYFALDLLAIQVMARSTKPK